MISAKCVGLFIKIKSRIREATSSGMVITIQDGRSSNKRYPHPFPPPPTQGGREGEREGGRRRKERKSQWMIKIAWLLEAETSSSWMTAGHAHRSTSTLISSGIRLRPLRKGHEPGLEPEWESTVSVQRTIKQLLLSRDFQLSGGPGE